MKGNLAAWTRTAIAGLLLAQLAVPGCGKQPMKPNTRTAAGGSASNTYEMPSEDERHTAPGEQYIPPNWHGGPGSLPMGPDITPQEIVAHLDSIPALQTAKNEFSARGYVRHPELDSLRINETSSTVLLGYQRPGYNLQEAEAYIIVVSRRITVFVTAQIGNPDEPGVFHEGQVPVTLYRTQVGGGLIVHPSPDSVMFTAGSEDPPH